jgi:hypothetical protein
MDSKKDVKETMDEIEKMCKPIADYLNKNYDPYCTITINSAGITLVRSEMFIPLEVPD